MEIPGLAALERVDAVAAGQLVRLVRRLAGHAEAGRRAIDQIPLFLAADADDERLRVLVTAVRRTLPGAEIYALAWDGDFEAGTAAVVALAGDGAVIPHPREISRTLVGEAARSGQAVWVEDPAADPRFAAAASMIAGRSQGAVPVGPGAALGLAFPGQLPAPFDRQQVELLAAVAARCRVERPVAAPPPPVPGLIGDSPPMRALRAQIRSFAAVPWPALVLGETGTGKEAVARALHTLSDRKDEPFVPVNAAAIPDELAESTLFGHERGAFTGADRRRVGLVERAGSGTLFLDEIGDVSPKVQSRLLRVLQEGRFERVGGDGELTFRGRVVAATLRPIDRAETGFRADLYHRLAACVLRVPPLRDRRGDIPALAAALLARAAEGLPGPASVLAEETVRALEGRRWWGNVRELENTLKTALALARAERSVVIRPRHLPPEILEDPPLSGGAPSASRSPEPTLPDVGEGLAAALAACQRRTVQAALDAEGGNRAAAARRLGVSPQWLFRLLARWREPGG